MKINITNILKKISVQSVFIIYSISIIVVIIILIVTPFRTGQDVTRGILTIPKNLTISNFIDVWNKGLNIGFRNSLFFGIITCFFTVIIGGVAAYGFAFFNFRFKNILFRFMFSGIFISLVLIVLPLFLQYRDLGLINSFFGILLIYVGIRIPFTIYLFRSFFEEFPSEIIEAAKIDGANEIRTLTKIVFPLSKPVVITVVLFNFVAIWTDLLIGLLFLQKFQNQTVMVKIINIFYTEPTVINVTPLAQGYAGLFISTVPVILIYFFTKKHYIEGLTLGSIK